MSVIGNSAQSFNLCCHVLSFLLFLDKFPFQFAIATKIDELEMTFLISYDVMTRRLYDIVKGYCILF
jgi:hypothetical protein